MTYSIPFYNSLTTTSDINNTLQVDVRTKQENIKALIEKHNQELRDLLMKCDETTTILSEIDGGLNVITYNRIQGKRVLAYGSIAVERHKKTNNELCTDLQDEIEVTGYITKNILLS